jgi:4-amino-4-deoxy-L-arabinose transferase-like glycosyltransferase
LISFGEVDDMTVEKFAISFVILCTCLIVLHLLSRRWPLAEDRIGWFVFALFLLYISVESWLGTVDSIRDGRFVRVAHARFRDISYHRIVTSLKDDPAGFWANVVVSLLVCSVLVYLSTLALRRAMKRSRYPPAAQNPRPS